MPPVEMARLKLPDTHLAQLRELLARHVPDAEVWAYGSRVNDTAHEGSDLDLVLRHPTDLNQDVDGWLELKEALQESRLPILVEIHLWAHLPTAFHDEIERCFVVVQEGSSA
jgi:predicted nucleotidyltransferase